MPNEVTDVEAVETLLTDAIGRYMKAPRDDADHELGKAHGIAEALAVLRHTTFEEEWSTGLVRYQATRVPPITYEELRG